MPGIFDRPRAQLDFYPVGSAPIAYALADRGARLLIQRDGVEFANVEWSRKNRKAGRLFIEHQLGHCHVNRKFADQMNHGRNSSRCDCRLAQQRDEVYNYGSFKQSRMFAAGVTCSDCHDPHSAKLRFPGDDTCLQCHSTEKYANAKHAGHEAASPPLGCASCHMPVRNYMVVDPRHDHSFRVPRPDLSATLGTPNACNDCHADKPAAWAASAVERWHGPNRKGLQTFAEALDAAWTDKANAATRLAAVAADGGSPAIARASALTELASRVLPSNMDLARSGLADSDPMVRIAALDMLENVPAGQIWTLVAPLLSDPSQGVRIRAASLLASVPTVSQPAADRDRFERAAAEFIAAQRLNADRPEAGGDQPRRSLSAAQTGWRWRERAARGGRCIRRRCGAASRARLDLDPAALEYAERLARITPNDRELAGLIEALRHAAKKPDGP